MSDVRDQARETSTGSRVPDDVSVIIDPVSCTLNEDGFKRRA